MDCFACDEEIVGEPVVRGGVFEVEHNFCSEECADEYFSEEETEEDEEDDTDDDDE